MAANHIALRIVSLCAIFIQASSNDSESTSIVYHMLPSKYTGLAQKNAGDFHGDVNFIITCLGGNSGENPECKVKGDVLEKVSVTVSSWGEYTPCNVCQKGQKGKTCVDNYFCSSVKGGPGIKFSSSSKPGRVVAGFPGEPTGLWYSFPAASEGHTWSQKVLQRISVQCMYDAWCAAAGHSSNCGKNVVKALSDKVKKSTWDATWNKGCGHSSSTASLPSSPQNKSHQHHNKSHARHNESHHHNRSHHHQNKSHHHNKSELLVTGGGCHNIHDGLILKAHGKHRVNTDLWHCADDLAKKEPHSDHEKRTKLDDCINDKLHKSKGKNKGKLSKDCVGCFANSVLCAEKKCLEECGTHGHKCDDCMKKKCKGGFDECSHLKSTSFADVEEDTTSAPRAFFI